MKLIYLANACLPTESAHGYQIAKMCEAFTQNGTKVLLLHPFRHQHNPSLKQQSVFDYYSVPPIFKVRTLPNFDVLLLERFFRRPTFISIFFAHTLLWGLYATLVARREKADLFYTRDAAIAYWLVQLGLPTVYEAHVVPKRAQRWLLRRMAHQPALQRVVVLTSFILQRLVEMGFQQERVIVLPDGVDLSLFEGLPSKEACRHRLGLPQDRLIIGYIGRFRTMQMEKGIPEMVAAMGHLPSLDGKEPLLLCVGGPMDVVPAYLNLARRLGVPEHRVQFVDRVPNREVPFWIRACDVVTIPWPWTEFSAYFTSPLKLFEYMAAGVPIVATDLPSICEVLHHGENAWLVEPGNPKALAEGIAQVVSDGDLGNSIVSCARQGIGEYTWEHRAREILEHIGDF